MSPSVRIGEHLRGNAVAYVALFVALTGTSYAATKVTSKDIKKNAVLAKHVKDGEMTGVDVANDSLTGQQINEATLQGLNGELNAFRAQLQNPGTVNGSGNPVDFSNLKNVPAGFADGTDNTGAAPANNSLGAAEPTGAPEDEIVDGAIDSEDLANGTIADADISPSAAIDDAKLGPINDAGKVADSALSGNVALRDAAQTFGGASTFTNRVAFDLADQEVFEIEASPTGTGFHRGLSLFYENDTTGSTQEIGLLMNSAESQGTTETLLRLANFALSPVPRGLDFDSNAAGITTAIDASDPNIGAALDIGANDIQTNTATISSTELGRLDGSPTGSVPLPLTSFVNTTDSATLDFTASNGTSPDLSAPAGLPVIEWDDDSDGIGGDTADTDFVATSFIVPADYASGGALRLRYRTLGTTGDVLERIVCEGAENTGGFTVTDSQGTGVPNFFQSDLLEGVDYDPNESIVFRCKVDDGANGTTADDPLRIHSAAFVYTATR